MRTLCIQYDETQTHPESGEPFDLMAYVENEFDNAGFSTVLWDTPTPLREIERALSTRDDLIEAAKEALKCIEQHVPATTFAPRGWLRDAITKAEEA
jgi:hypothetical protein